MIIYIIFIYLYILKMLRKPCTNVSSDSYNSNEKSPKYFGLSAEGYDLGIEMVGQDNMLWVVHTKNNRKVWVRKFSINKITHETPIIIEKNTVIEEEKEIERPPSPIKEEPSSEKEEVLLKKQTDYNIFLKYRLTQLKLSNTDKTITNKMLFAKTAEEWKELKKNSQELKNVLEKIKKEKL